MAKSTHNDILDAALNYVADNGDRIFICSAEPTDYTEASSTYALAVNIMTEGDGNGDYTIADGDASGRKLTVSEQATITVDTTGTATHIAIGDSVASKLLLVTTCTSQLITIGNTATIPAFDEEIADPT